jgi:hypothetical protein
MAAYNGIRSNSRAEIRPSERFAGESRLMRVLDSFIVDTKTGLTGLLL